MKSHEIMNVLIDVKQLSIELSEYLKSIGVISKVFDRQDSGCVSYDAATKQGNFFVKYSETESVIKHLEGVIGKGANAIE